MRTLFGFSYTLEGSISSNIEKTGRPNQGVSTIGFFQLVNQRLHFCIHNGNLKKGSAEFHNFKYVTNFIFYN